MYRHTVSRIMPPPATPKDVHVLIPRTCDYVRSQGKGEWAYRWNEIANQLTSGWGDYPGPSGWFQWITEVCISRRERTRGMGGWEGLAQNCWLWRWEKEPRAQKCRQPLGAGRGRGTDSPLELPEQNTALLTSRYCPVLDIYISELQDHKFVWF